jgi:hypothetical protein
MDRAAARPIAPVVLCATIGAALLLGTPSVAGAVPSDRWSERWSERSGTDATCVQNLTDPAGMPADEPRLRDLQSFGKWVQNRFAPSAVIEPDPAAPSRPETVAPTVRRESVQFPQRVIPLRL